MSEGPDESQYPAPGPAPDDAFYDIDKQRALDRQHFDNRIDRLDEKTDRVLDRMDRYQEATNSRLDIAETDREEMGDEITALQEQMKLAGVGIMAAVATAFNKIFNYIP